MSERLSISAFARASGCDEKQVRRAIEKGVLHKGDDGLLPADQLEIGWRRVNRRTVEKLASDKSARRLAPSDKSDTSDIAPVVRPDETPVEAADRIFAAGGADLPIDEAVKRKENYLGLLKQLEYDTKAGAVVSIAEVGARVGAEYAKVRTRLLAIPSEKAPAIHRLATVAEVEGALRTAIVRALEELLADGDSTLV